MPDKYRGGGSQSATGQSMGSPKEELEKGLKAANSFSLLGTFSSSITGDPVLHPIDDCEHLLLYLSGTGRASQGTAISGSCQQALVGIHNIAWVW